MRGSMRDAVTRNTLAMVVVLVGLFGVIGFAIAAISLAGSDNRQAVIQQTITALFALLGTWVGTVLAFYFSRQNLTAATDSTIAAITAAQGGGSTPVRQAMTPRGQFVAYPLGPGEDQRAVKLSDLASKMSEGNVHRIVVLDSQDTVVCVIHDSLILALEKKAGAEDPAAARDLTVGSLLDDAEFSDKPFLMAFVGETATVDEARGKMVSGCNDVFVTTRGGPKDPVVGWLTNTRLAQTE